MLYRRSLAYVGRRARVQARVPGDESGHRIAAQMTDGISRLTRLLPPSDPTGAQLAPTLNALQRLIDEFGRAQRARDGEPDPASELERLKKWTDDFGRNVDQLQHELRVLR